MNLLVNTDMELNCLQVAVDDLIDYLEDVLEGEEPDERYIVEERLVAARTLKQRLDEMEWQDGDES
jgi:hypothetical protein